MVENMKTLLLMLLLVGSAHAEVYKSTNADGETVYSDTRTQGAEVLKMPELPTYTPPPVAPPAAASTGSVVKEADIYEDMVFVRPEDDATIRDNQGTINAELKLTPSLRSNSKHRIQFYLDGDAYGKPGSSVRATMNNIDRGEHILTASVLDARGEPLITTPPVVVHLHRETIYNPKNPNNPNRPKPSPRS
jgi:hypothetical protein